MISGKSVQNFISGIILATFCAKISKTATTTTTTTTTTINVCTFIRRVSAQVRANKRQKTNNNQSNKCQLNPTADIFLWQSEKLVKRNCVPV